MNEEQARLVVVARAAFQQARDRRLPRRPADIGEQPLIAAGEAQPDGLPRIAVAAALQVRKA